MNKWTPTIAGILLALFMGTFLTVLTWNDGYIFIQYSDHIETVTIKQFWQNGGCFNRQYNGEHYLFTSRPSYTAMGWLKLMVGLVVSVGGYACAVYAYYCWSLGFLGEKLKKIFGIFKKST